MDAADRISSSTEVPRVATVEHPRLRAPRAGSPAVAQACFFFDATKFAKLAMKVGYLGMVVHF